MYILRAKIWQFISHSKISKKKHLYFHLPKDLLTNKEKQKQKPKDLLIDKDKKKQMPNDLLTDKEI
jgi:hypothetical protein